MSGVAPTQQELARRARRAAMNKYQTTADKEKNGFLNEEEERQAGMYRINWTNLGFETPPASEYGDDDVEATATAEGATLAGTPKVMAVNAAADGPTVKKTNYLGVPLGTFEFGTYSGKCMKWTALEKATIKEHMGWKKALEKRWAEKYACQPYKPKCSYV
jgi:hypothetical protein